MDDKTKDFYVRLKDELEKERSWPGPYLFKFIVPGQAEKIAQIEEIFDGTNADIQIRNSSNGKFSSVSIKVVMQDGQAIVDKYIAVSSVEGIISL